LGKAIFTLPVERSRANRTANPTTENIAAVMCVTTRAFQPRANLRPVSGDAKQPPHLQPCPKHSATRPPRVELVILDDPTFSAVRGAAFWLRMRMDWSYYDGFEDDIMSKYDMVRDGHIEL
jgi:hypothetical protein